MVPVFLFLFFAVVAGGDYYSDKPECDHQVNPDVVIEEEIK